MPGKPPKGLPPDTRVKTRTSPKVKEPSNKADRATAPAEGGSSTEAANGGLKLPPYKKVKLQNGMTLLLMEQHEVPIISFNFLTRSGSVADPAGKEGLASVTAALLRKGTRTRSADQLSAELDFIGGQLARARLTITRTASQSSSRKTSRKGSSCSRTWCSTRPSRRTK